MYADSQGRFTVPLPDGWENISTSSLAHFVNTDRTVNMYILPVTANDLQPGIKAALSQVFGQWDVNVPPIQTREIPLPNGAAWTQNLYALEGGDLVAAIGRVVDGLAYVIITRAKEAALAKTTSAINEVVFGFRLAGETAATDARPNYVDTNTFTEQDVTVGSGDWQLPGTVVLPIGKGPFPALVLVLGSGPVDRDETIGLNKPFRDIAQGLASQGIVVLRYDKRTQVYQSRFASATDMDFTIDDEEITDALAAVSLLQGMKQVDPSHIYVAGHSEGGRMAPRIGARDSHIAGLILLAGDAKPFDVTLRDQANYIISLDRTANDQVASTLTLADRIQAISTGADPLKVFNGSRFQASYWASFIAYDPVATAQRLTIPMLILQGERDYQVTMDDFALWQSALADHSNVTFKSYPTLTHLFIELGDLSRMAIPADYGLSGFVDETVINDIATWVKTE